MIIYDVTVFRFILFEPRGEGGWVLLEILTWLGVLPGSPNPDPISDKKVPFFALVLRPGARFSKVRITFRVRNQTCKSKYKE